MKAYYEEAGITIFCGDCREVLPTLPKPSLVVTDPPFGFGYSSGYGASWENTQIANDSDTSARDSVIELCGGAAMAVFGSWKRLRPIQTKAVLIWDKGPAFGMGDLSFPWKNSFEEIYIIGDGWKRRNRDQGVIRGHFAPFAESAGRCHPNEKPVTLMQYLIESHPCDVVYDPFAGSGTCLEAAKFVGRRAIGIEIEERYCEIAAKRLSQSVLDFGAPAVELQQNQGEMFATIEAGRNALAMRPDPGSSPDEARQNA